MSTTNNLEESTDATKDQIEYEETVDSEILEEMVRKKVATKTKNMNAELGQLKKQIAILNKLTDTNNNTKKSKKSRRGLTKLNQGVSIVKKESSCCNPKETAPKVAAPAKGTTKNKQRKMIYNCWKKCHHGTTFHVPPILQYTALPYLQLKYPSP